jgi:hypothetical protein
VCVERDQDAGSPQEDAMAAGPLGRATGIGGVCDYLALTAVSKL